MIKYARLLLKHLRVMSLPIGFLAQSAELSRDTDPDAWILLKPMLDQLAGLKVFQFHTIAGYEVLQEDGQVIQFLESRDVSIDRPG